MQLVLFLKAQVRRVLREKSFEEEIPYHVNLDLHWQLIHQCNRIVTLNSQKLVIVPVLFEVLQHVVDYFLVEPLILIEMFKNNEEPL